MAKSYNKYEYETSPRKLEPYYVPKNQKTKKQKKTAKQNKQQKKLKIKIICYSILSLAILFGISYGNAQIDENFNKLQVLKDQLASIEKENTQLEVAIESNLSLTNLEQQAKNILGMQKLTNKQTEYVLLPKTDYIEVASEQVKIEEEKPFFDTILSWIKQLFK